jgi:hypothetical protein
MQTDTETRTVQTRTITLTSRPPVKIQDDQWPLIAHAYWHDGVVECQANRKGWLKVRQHADGRIIVYGGYDSNWPKEPNLRGGEILIPPGDGPLTPDDGRVVDDRVLAAAIHRVAASVRCAEIAEHCIADLPAEVI